MAGDVSVYTMHAGIRQIWYPGNMPVAGDVNAYMIHFYSALSVRIDCTHLHKHSWLPLNTPQLVLCRPPSKAHNDRVSLQCPLACCGTVAIAINLLQSPNHVFVSIAMRRPRIPEAVPEMRCGMGFRD